MSRVSLVRASSVTVAALLGSCSMSERSQSEETARAADSARATAAASTQRRVSMVMIGRRLGAGNRVTEPTFQFAPEDTVYVSVATQGSVGPDSLTAAWRYQSGEILRQSSERVEPAGQNAVFVLSQAKGLKPGTYKVVLFLGDDSVDARVFAVTK